MVVLLDYPLNKSLPFLLPVAKDRTILGRREAGMFQAP